MNLYTFESTSRARTVVVGLDAGSLGARIFDAVQGIHLDGIHITLIIILVPAQRLSNYDGLQVS